MSCLKNWLKLFTGESRSAFKWNACNITKDSKQAIAKEKKIRSIMYTVFTINFDMTIPPSRKNQHLW